MPFAKYTTLNVLKEGIFTSWPEKRNEYEKQSFPLCCSVSRGRDDLDLDWFKLKSQTERNAKFRIVLLLCPQRFTILFLKPNFNQ